MLPTIPTPMTTTSTSFKRCATVTPSAYGCRNFRMDVYVPLSILADAHGRSFKLHAVAVDRFVVVRVCAGKADHPPRHHVAIAAIHRIAEETFNRHLQQHVEEHGGWNAVQVVIALLQRLQVVVLSIRGQLAERRPLPGEIRVDGAQSRAKQLR